MKNILLVTLLVLSQLGYAQKDVYLNISHFLGSNPFAFNTTATNDLGNEFNVNRLEYYISNIKIVHDGGATIKVSNTWILANADTPVNQFLGNYNITNLESVIFSVGVGANYNHLDPASYPMGHPLAPKSPSMHWGWTPGYRFLAIEGKCGSNLNLIFEIHALGDVNYFEQEVVTSGTVNGGDLNINLKADYEMILKGIDLSSGPFSHGETGVSLDALENCSTSVFTADANNPTGINKVSDKLKVSIFPNPTTKNVTISSDIEGLIDIRVFNLLGQEVKSITNVEPSGAVLSFDNVGLHFINVYQSGSLLGSYRVSVSK
ncbi:MAG: MbnP family protein [Salibacteraceae bacterium]